MTEQVSDHESAFVEAFVPAAQRQRALRLLGQRGRGRKQYEKFSTWLSHRVPLDPRYVSPLPASTRPEALAARLRSKGAGETCWLLSDTAAEGEVSLVDAMAEVFSGDGAIVSCLAGRLAVYAPEYPGERLLLER